MMTVALAKQQAAAKVGKQIKEAREAKGMSVREVAAAAGIYHPQLVTIENGKGNPTVGTVAAIGAALGVTLEI